MSGLEWDDALATGNAAIDAQHRELFARANRFFASAGKPGRPREVKIALEFLAGYVRIHFADEEALMADLGYPRLADHAREHRDYVQRLEALQAGIDADADPVSAAAGLRALLTGWLFEHIGRADRDVADYARAHRKPAP